MSGSVDHPKIASWDRPVEFAYRKLPKDWPISVKDGKITLPNTNTSGQTLSEFLEKTFEPGAARTIVELIQKDISARNEKISAIASSTEVTSNPELFMSAPSPKDRNVYQRLNWHELKLSLEASGAKITDVAETSAPRSARAVFTRDRGAALQGGIISFHLPTTQGVSAVDVLNANLARADIETVLKKDGVPSTHLVGFIEGGDVLRHPQSNTVFVGMYPELPKEPQIKVAEELAGMLGMKLVMVPKTKVGNPDPSNPDRTSYYHLDTFMSVLPDGSAVLIPDATTPEARDMILKAVSGHGDVLELPIKEGESSNQAFDRRRLATNLVTINGNSFTPNALPEMQEFFAERGFRLIEGPYGLSDSGPHCQTNFKTLGTPDGRSDIAALHEAIKDMPQLAFADLPKMPPQFSPKPVESNKPLPSEILTGLA